MKVVYSSSNEYVKYTGISLLSMLDNNRNNEDLEYYIISDNIDESNKKKLHCIGEKFSKKINFINADILYKKIGRIISNKLELHNGAYNTWLRLFPNIIFPNCNDTILYIDSDTIIDGKLDSLFKIDWGEKALAAVNIPSVDLGEFLKVPSEKKIIQDRGGNYFNAGIILYEMSNFNKKKYFEKIKDCLLNKNYFFLKDQSVLNEVFSCDDIVELDYIYNYSLHIKPKYSKVLENSTEIKDLKAKPVIIHYPGQLSRPWYSESISNLKERYIYYMKKSPWKNEKLQSYLKSEIYQGYGIIRKIIIYLMLSLFNTRIYGYLYNKKRKW